MTYLELYKRANRMLDSNEITLGEYEEMIKPLEAEVARWIPCSERLPDEREIVCVTAYICGEPFVLLSYLEGGEWFGGGTGYWNGMSVRAWMPFTEPYTEPYKEVEQ